MTEQTLQSIKRCCNIDVLTQPEKSFLEAMITNIVTFALDRQVSQIKEKIATIPRHAIFTDVNFDDLEDAVPPPQMHSAIKVEDVMKVLNEFL